MLLLGKQVISVPRDEESPKSECSIIIVLNTVLWNSKKVNTAPEDPPKTIGIQDPIYDIDLCEPPKIVYRRPFSSPKRGLRRAGRVVCSIIIILSCSPYMASRRREQTICSASSRMRTILGADTTPHGPILFGILQGT